MSDYTWDDVVSEFVRSVARGLTSRYRGDVEYEDVHQELLLWLYGKGQSKVLRWLGNEPQQTTRISRELWRQGARYCVKERAARRGYEPDDVQWYSEKLVYELLPYALDPTFDGTPDREGEPDEKVGRRSTRLPEQQSDLMAMVMDVRRAISKVGYDVQSIVDFLGGERPFSGRRRPMSNAQSIAVTREQE